MTHGYSVKPGVTYQFHNKTIKIIMVILDFFVFENKAIKVIMIPSQKMFPFITVLFMLLVFNGEELI